MAMGRPREFDIEDALDVALRLFWSKGYDGVSVNELSEAIGISKPSLYSAFGSKEELFQRVVDKYDRGPADYFRSALSRPTAREVVEGLFMGSAEAMSNPGLPAGCLEVLAALPGRDHTDASRRELNSRRSRRESELFGRLEMARSTGELPSEIDCGNLARYVTAILQGMAVQAVGGASRSELQAIAQFAIRSWPPA